jgi:hypothetical protein
MHGFVSKHHNLFSFCWPMFNMIMLCQLIPGLEFLITEIAFEFLPIKKIEFHYFYYWYTLHINQRFKISQQNWFHPYHWVPFLRWKSAKGQMFCEKIEVPKQMSILYYNENWARLTRHFHTRAIGIDAGLHC